jgi:fructose-bisphosphate aldolase, class I
LTAGRTQVKSFAAERSEVAISAFQVCTSYSCYTVQIIEENNFYAPLMKDPRVVALSGDYSRDSANEKLTQNTGLIASFSHALAEGLSAQQSDKEFDTVLNRSIESIYKASIT